MMIQGLSEENRFLTCLWPSNTLSLSRKSQTWKFREIYIKLHGLVVQMSFIWDFEIVCKDEFSGSTTLFTWRQRFLLISNRGSPSLQHFCIMFFFEFAMPRKSWKRKGTSVSAEVKIRPKSCGYWKSKMEVASCCLSEPRNVWRAPFAPNGRCCRRCFPCQLMSINWHITRKVSKCIRALSMKQCCANRGTASFLGWAPSAMPGEESLLKALGQPCRNPKAEWL